MLVLDGVDRYFNNKPAVSGVSLTVRRGSFVGVIGRRRQIDAAAHGQSTGRPNRGIDPLR